MDRLFTVENLLLPHHTEVRESLMQLEKSLHGLTARPKADLPLPSAQIQDQSIRQLNAMDDNIIHLALLEGGHIEPKPQSKDCVSELLYIVRYIPIDIRYVGAVMDSKTETYQLMIVIPDSIEIIIENNKQMIDMILSRSSRKFPKVIMTESQFNILEYRQACIFKLDRYQNKLTFMKEEKPDDNIIAPEPR